MREFDIAELPRYSNASVRALFRHRFGSEGPLLRGAIVDASLAPRGAAAPPPAPQFSGGLHAAPRGFLALGLTLCLSACDSDTAPTASASRDASPTHTDALANVDAPTQGSRLDGARDGRRIEPLHDGRATESGSSIDAAGRDASARTDSAPSDGALRDTRTPDRVAFDSAPDAPSDYPLGPYGGDVGDTIAYMTWIGYVNVSAMGLATAQPFVPYSTDDLRRSGARYALVHVSDFDCPGCNHAAGDLGANGKSLVDAGAAVVEVLGSQGFFFPADKAHLTAWVDAHDLAVTSVIDAPGRELDTLGLMHYRETSVIVDLRTMTIIWKKLAGDLDGTSPTSVSAAVTEMERLLGG